MGASIIVYYLLFVTIGYTGVSTGPTLPTLAAQTGSTISQISIIFSARSVGGLIGSLWVSRLFDKISGHKLLALVSGALAVLMFFTPLIPSLSLLGMLMVLLGLSEASIDIGGNTLLIWLYKDKAASYLNGMHLMFGIGAVIAPLVVAQILLRTGGIKWVFWLISIAPLILMVILLKIPSPEKNIKKESESVKFEGGVIVLALFFYAYVAAEVAYGGWIYTYTVATNLADDVTAAYFNSAFFLALTIGRIISIPMATRFRLYKIVQWNFIGAFISMAILIAGRELTEALLIGSIGLGLSFASMFPSMLSIADKYLGVSGKIMGWFFAASSLGAMTVPWLIGQLFESVGPQSFIWSILVVLVISLVSFISFEKKYVRI